MGKAGILARLPEANPVPQRALKGGGGGGTGAPSSCDLIGPSALPAKTQQWAHRGAAISEAEPRAGPQVWCIMASSARETSWHNNPRLDSGSSFNPETVCLPTARHSHRGRQGDPAGGWQLARMLLAWTAGRRQSGGPGSPPLHPSPHFTPPFQKPFLCFLILQASWSHFEAGSRGWALRG